MQLTVQMFQPLEHYETICGWWQAHQWPVIPPDMLPETGLVAYVDGKPAAACWIYRTDSSICWPEWMVSNPGLPSKQRSAGIEFLLDAVVSTAASLGFTRIFTLIKPKYKRYIKRLEARGCVRADEGIVYVRRV